METHEDNPRAKVEGKMNYSKLRELANACKDLGPWEYFLETGMEGHGMIVRYKETENGFHDFDGPHPFKRLVCKEELKLFIAELSPEKVLSLLDQLDKMREALEYIAMPYNEFKDKEPTTEGLMSELANQRLFDIDKAKSALIEAGLL